MSKYHNVDTDSIHSLVCRPRGSAVVGIGRGQRRARCQLELTSSRSETVHAISAGCSGGVATSSPRSFLRRWFSSASASSFLCIHAQRVSRELCAQQCTPPPRQSPPDVPVRWIEFGAEDSAPAASHGPSPAPPPCARESRGGTSCAACSAAQKRGSSPSSSVSCAAAGRLTRRPRLRRQTTGACGASSSPPARCWAAIWMPCERQPKLRG